MWPPTVAAAAFVSHAWAPVLVRLLPLLLLTLGHGCGTSSTPPPDAAPAPDGSAPDAGADGTSVSDDAPSSIRRGYCSPVAQALCREASVCGCGRLPTWPDESACATAMTARCMDAILVGLGGSEAGALVADPGAVAECAEQVLTQAAPCEATDLAARFAGCSAALFEAVELGDPCAGESCAAGTGECVEGKCQALPFHGEACVGRCAAGAACVDGQCAVPAREGETCADPASCEFGLRCVDALCVRPVASGGSCADARHCQAGLRCELGACAAAPTTCDDGTDCGSLAACVREESMRCLPRGGPGEPCVLDAECSEVTVCVDGWCVARGGLGAACDRSAACEQSLRCSIDGTCSEGPLPGDPCALDRRCADGAFCDPDRDRCAAQADQGQECASDSMCGPGLFCHFGSGRCQATFGLGFECHDGNECGPEAVCVMVDDASYACGPLPLPGEPCTFACAVGSHCSRAAADGLCLPKICNLLD